MKIDLIGQRFGRLLVQSRSPRTDGRNVFWFCLCACGKLTEVFTGQLRSGMSKSCGCLARELASARETTHGCSDSKIYLVWQAMKNRCYNPKQRAYPYYGGRGIKVCDRWRNSFEAFMADVGLPPTDKHQIDRINNNGNYEPGNVKWSTRSEQMLNRRPRSQWKQRAA